MKRALVAVAVVAAASMPFVASAEQGAISTVAGDGTTVSPATRYKLAPKAVGVDRAGNTYIGQLGQLKKVDAAGVVTNVARTNTQMVGGMAVDNAGNVFYADGFSGVYKVDTQGVVHEIAGLNHAGYSGDGGPANHAALNHPSGVAFDPAGNLLIADSYNGRIRKIDGAGIITTVAGGGSPCLGYGNPAISACFGAAQSVAADHLGNIFIVDASDGDVSMVDPQGILRLVTGDVFSAQEASVDASGTLYVLDGNNKIYRVALPSGERTHVAGRGTNGYEGDGGPATEAIFGMYANAFAVDPSGRYLQIADATNFRLRVVDLSINLIDTQAGNGTSGDEAGGPATASTVDRPNGVTVDAAGNMYIADTANHLIRKVNTAGMITVIAGNGLQGFAGDGGRATHARLDSPSSVAVDGSGNLYVTEATHRVRKVDTAGVISTLAGNGTAGYSGDGGPATSASLASPAGVAVDTAGNVYIADRNNHRVRKVSAGVITTVAGSATSGYCGDGAQATSACLNAPAGVAVDGTGTLFITDSANSRVRKVTNGVITTFAGDGTPGFAGDGGQAFKARLADPVGVAVDAGTVYVADSGNNRIRRIDPSGRISSVAGNGTKGYSGDTGLPSKTALNNPRGVAAKGAVYVADTDNHRIRKVIPSPIPVANEDVHELAGGQTLLGNVLENDIGDGRTVISYGQPRWGTVTMARDGEFSYTPDFSSDQADSFTYTARDLLNMTATGTVTLRPPVRNREAR